MNSQNSKNTDFNVKKPHIFDPSVEVKNILKFPSNERKLALENFYKNLEKYHADLVGVFDYARTEFGDLDLSNKTDEEIDAEIEKFLQKFGEKIENFDEKTKSKILEWIAKYTENKKNAYKKLKEFEENPWDFFVKNGMKMDVTMLFRKMGVDFFGEKMPDVKVDVYKGNLVLRIPQEERKNFDMIQVAGDYSPQTGTIRLIEQENVRNTLIHETQHSDNKIFMNDNYEQIEKARQETLIKNNNFYDNLKKESENYDWLENEIALRRWDEIAHDFHLKNALLRFRDEIIAQLKGGTHEEALEKIFFLWYDYFENIKSYNPILYFSLWKNYSEKIAKYIEEAQWLVKNNVSLDILAITPIEKWGRLLKNSLKNSENIWENFVFKNIENLENGNFSARKIFENGEIWEGIFDKNKKFLEWKTIIGDEIQEWKFHNDKLVFWRIQIWENWQYGKFLKNGMILQDGIIYHGGICGIIKNSKLTGEYGNLRDWNEEKTKCEGAIKIPTQWLDIVVEKKWKFELRWAELVLSDGIIEVTKIQTFKPVEGPIKFNTFPVRKKMKNFFRENKLNLKIQNNQLVLTEEDWEKLENFIQKNYFYDLRKILMDFGLGSLHEQRKAKKNVETILQK